MLQLKQCIFIIEFPPTQYYSNTVHVRSNSYYHNLYMNYIVDTKKKEGEGGGSTHGCLSRGAPAGCTCGVHPWEHPASCTCENIPWVSPAGVSRGCAGATRLHPRVPLVGCTHGVAPAGCARGVGTRRVPSTGCNRGGLHCQSFPNGYPESRCFCYVDLALDDIISTVTFQSIKRKGERSFREQSPEEQRIFEENSESRVF